MYKYICMYKYIYIYMYVCIYICIHEYVHIYICMYVCIYVHIFVYLSVYAYTYTSDMYLHVHVLFIAFAFECDPVLTPFPRSRIARRFLSAPSHSHLPSRVLLGLACVGCHHRLYQTRRCSRLLKV